MIVAFATNTKNSMCVLEEAIRLTGGRGNASGHRTCEGQGGRPDAGSPRCRAPLAVDVKRPQLQQR